jgi:hypothetical protein
MFGTTTTCSPLLLLLVSLLESVEFDSFTLCGMLNMTEYER